MGRRNKSYSISLHKQAYNRLNLMQAFGESKSKAKKEDSMDEKIFSFSTYKTYWKHIGYFLDYINKTYPNCTTLSASRKYVKEWLTLREQQNLSAWTIQTEAKALGKLFQIKPSDKDYYDPPKRLRENIKRSRGDALRDKHFSEKNNDEFIKFCKGTGVRRYGITKLKGGSLYSKQEIELKLEHLLSNTNSLENLREIAALTDTKLFEEEYYLRLVEKGGRVRYSPIIGKDAPLIIERVRNTPFDKHVFEYIPSKADIHSYRADYATAIYKEYARDIEDIPIDSINSGTGRSYQSEVYFCRKDESGKKLDKRAMLLCSKALGHNRIQIVADNYIRGL